MYKLIVSFACKADKAIKPNNCHAQQLDMCGIFINY